MDKELLKMEIYTKATNIQALVMNNLDNTTIDYVIAEIEYMKNKATELKKEMEM
jgi:hypothetical protein